MRHIPRFYCPDLSLQVDAVVTLPESAAHHARTVLRMRDGDAVRLFNAKDGEWNAICQTVDKKSVTVAITDFIRPAEKLRDVTLVLAPLKNKDSFDNAIRHAVELGVSGIAFVQTAYTQQPKLNMDRLQQQVIDAVQQCGRLTVPTLSPVQPFKTWLKAKPADTVVLACVEGRDGTSPPLPKDLENIKNQNLILLIGPEGGFSDEEKALLTADRPDIHPVSLGPLTLRSDTAVAVAVGFCLNL